MPRTLVLLAAGVLAAVTPSAAAAQAPAAAAAEVRALVDSLFAGMQNADSAAVRATFADGARFAEVDTAGAVRYRPVDGWIRAIANSGKRWREEVYDVEIRVDQHMAQVWAPYTFHLDGKVRHCGVDTMELLKTPAGWRITQLSDTRRMEGCR